MVKKKILPLMLASALAVITISMGISGGTLAKWNDHIKVEFPPLVIGQPTCPEVDFNNVFGNSMSPNSGLGPLGILLSPELQDGQTATFTLELNPEWIGITNAALRYGLYVGALDRDELTGSANDGEMPDMGGFRLVGWTENNSNSAFTSPNTQPVSATVSIVRNGNTLTVCGDTCLEWPADQPIPFDFWLRRIGNSQPVQGGNWSPATPTIRGTLRIFDETIVNDYNPMGELPGWSEIIVSPDGTPPNNCPTSLPLTVNYYWEVKFYPVPDYDNGTMIDEDGEIADLEDDEDLLEIEEDDDKSTIIDEDNEGDSEEEDGDSQEETNSTESEEGDEQ